MSLRSHLLLLTLGALAPLVAFAIGVVLIAVEREEAVFRGGATERTRALMTAVDTELESHATSLRTLANSLSLEKDELGAFHDEAERTLASQPHWSRVVLSRASGVDLVDASLPIGAEIAPVPDRSSFALALRTHEAAVGNLFVAAERPFFSVSVPILEVGEARYVLTVLVEPGSITKLLTPQRLPADWVGVVLDRDRRIVARTMDPERTVGRLASESLRAALDRGPEGWFHGKTLEGLDVYTPYNRSSATGWSVAIGIPAGVVEAGASRLVQVLLLGVLAALGTAAVLALALGRRITAPIASLASVARSLEEGEPVAEPPPSAVAEVRAVSRTLVTAANTAREREEALRAADRAKDEFLAMLGHELRNPLGALASAVELLQRGADGETAREAEALMGRQVRHMTRLVDDLLDVSRVTQGKVNLALRPVELGEVVARVLGDLRSSGRLEEHDVCARVERVWARGDAARLEQIAGNLVGNALKYTPPGGSVTVEVGPRGDDAVLAVEDTGVGMTPALRARVFELFEQGERSIDRRLGGLGIGLTLVRALAELQGGSAHATSEGPGLGSRFEVRLPATAPPAGSSEPEEPRAPGTAGDDGAARRRILLVEDNSDVRASLRAALSGYGHEVHEAGDGRAGIEVAARVRPEVAVVDIGLPGADGFEVARRLRALPDGAPALLVALTGYGQGESRRRALEAGFDEYMTKPVSPEDLARRIETAFPPAGGQA